MCLNPLDFSQKIWLEIVLNGHFHHVYTIKKYNILIEKGCCFMDKYVCTVCGYVYDPEIGDPDSGIAPGTAFEDIPDDWVCPLCGVGKDVFAKAE